MLGSLITSVLTMLATLAIAYGIDRWVFVQFNLGKPAAERAITASIGAILGGLLTCLLWVLFSWIILVKNRRSLAVSIIFIFIGLLAFIWFPLQMLSPFWLKVLYLFPTAPTNFQSTGLLVTALGILTLLLPGRNPVAR